MFFCSRRLFCCSAEEFRWFVSEEPLREEGFLSGSSETNHAVLLKNSEKRCSSVQEGCSAVLLKNSDGSFLKNRSRRRTACFKRRNRSSSEEPLRQEGLLVSRTARFLFLFCCFLLLKNSEKRR